MLDCLFAAIVGFIVGFTYLAFRHRHGRGSLLNEMAIPCFTAVLGALVQVGVEFHLTKRVEAQEHQPPIDSLRPDAHAFTPVPPGPPPQQPVNPKPVSPWVKAPSHRDHLHRITGCRPLRLAIFVDRSTSADSTGVPELHVADVGKVVRLLAHCGGKLNVSLIGGAPVLPVEVLAVAPFEKQLSFPGESPYLSPERRSSLEDSLLNAHATDYMSWSRVWEQQVNAYGLRLKRFLSDSTKVTRDRSPVCRAARVAADFFSEADRDPHSTNVAVFFSDGKDWDGSAPTKDCDPIGNEISVIVVNGMTADCFGHLKGLSPIHLRDVATTLQVVERLHNRHPVHRTDPAPCAHA